MSTPIPPHYTAFRITLVVVVLLGLAALTLWIARPAVLGAILDLLGVG